MKRNSKSIRLFAAALAMTLPLLLDWVKKHPRRFTYEDPTDISSAGFGSGIMFVLAVMKAEGDSENETTDLSMSKGIQYLKELQPYIMPEGERTSDMRDLMKHGDIWLMPYWNNDGLSEAQSFNIPFMKNYFPSYSMPVRNTPITIPAPAQHKLAALIFMNYALSDETQRTMAVQIRQIPANINVLKSNLPPSTFGVNTNLYEFTNKDTFSSYNNPKNIQWITQLMNFYPHGVLRR